MIINNITGGFEIINDDGVINNFANNEYISIEKFPDKIRLFNKISSNNEFFDLYPAQITSINGISTGYSTIDLLEKTIIAELLRTDANIKFEDSFNLDAFGRIRTSEPANRFDAEFYGTEKMGIVEF